MTRLSHRTATTTRFSTKAARNRRRQGIANIRSGGLLSDHVGSVLLTVFQQNAVLVPFDHHVWVADWNEATLEMCRVVLHQPRQRFHRSLELGWSWPFLLEHVLRRQFVRPGVRWDHRCRRRSFWRFSAAIQVKLVSHSNMGARRIFFRGGQIRGLGTKIPQRRPGMDPGGGKPPDADNWL